MRFLVRTLAAGIVVAAAQSPTSPRLIGEAPPPASVLNLWYRAPASDHPLLPPDAPRESRQAAAAEWVRALPVGNGRLGAMVFGGIVHERLQLNEDTLWAGRPYDPVNPRAKDALPEVRRLLAERKYPEAAKLVEARVMSNALAQMPYETVGDLALTFPQMDSVENYRRDLDLATATARSYTHGGVTFSREVFASAPDTVVSWHRDWLRHRWTRRSHRRHPGRPPIDHRIRTLVREMATANPLWGAPRIHGELRALGVDVSERTV